MPNAEVETGSVQQTLDKTSKSLSVVLPQWMWTLLDQLTERHPSASSRSELIREKLMSVPEFQERAGLNGNDSRSQPNSPAPA